MSVQPDGSSDGKGIGVDCGDSDLEYEVIQVSGLDEAQSYNRVVQGIARVVPAGVGVIGDKGSDVKRIVARCPVSVNGVKVLHGSGGYWSECHLLCEEHVL